MNRRRPDAVERALSADLDDALTSGWRRCPREGKQLAITRREVDGRPQHRYVGDEARQARAFNEEERYLSWSMPRGGSSGQTLSLIWFAAIGGVDSLGEAGIRTRLN